MFADRLIETALCNQEANEYFGAKIYGMNGPAVNGDVSFITTLRALLGDKLTDDKSLMLNTSISNRRIGDFNGSLEEVVYRISGFENDDVADSDVLGIHILNYKDSGDFMRFLKSGFTSTYAGYVQVEQVTEFFRKYMNVMCFVNPERRSAHLFVDGGYNDRLWHYLQCGIPAYLPWFFENGKLTDMDRELLSSLREKSSAKYAAMIAKYAEKYNFREMKIRRLLDGFEKLFEEQEKADLENQVRSIMDDIRDYSELISRRLREKRDLDARILGFSLKIDGADSESALMNYFLTNKALTLVSLENQRLRFVARGKLIFFDEDLAERVIENKNSYVYKPNGRTPGSISAEDMEMLMKAIFVDKKLYVNSCAAYEVVVGGGVCALGHYQYGREFDEYLPNQHIDQFRCLGNHERLIVQCIQNNDYIGAIAQCIASSQSLNFGDGVVMQQFMTRMYERDAKKFIVLPDGSAATPRQAIMYLRNANTVVTFTQLDEEGGNE